MCSHEELLGVNLFLSNYIIIKNRHVQVQESQQKILKKTMKDCIKTIGNTIKKYCNFI